MTFLDILIVIISVISAHFLGYMLGRLFYNLLNKDDKHD